MALRDRLESVATRLIGQHGDTVDIVIYIEEPGFDEFTPPTHTQKETPIKAVVTGASEWADGSVILQSDLAVLVSGEGPEADVDDLIKIDGVEYTVIQKRKILAAGVASAIRYFVRRG